MIWESNEMVLAIVTVSALLGALYGGFVMANVLKWYWWRFNGYGYFWGMVAGIGGAMVVPGITKSLIANSEFIQRIIGPAVARSPGAAVGLDDTPVGLIAVSALVARERGVREAAGRWWLDTRVVGPVGPSS